MQLSLRGLGEYPGYYCYDAGRPSWLPYWLDDWTESTCKARPSTIIGNVTSCLNPLSADCSTPTNPNPNISGPGAGGPPLAAGNSTASVEPIVTPDIPTAIGQTIGATVGGATSGLVTGLSDSISPWVMIAGLSILVLLLVKR
jgi:hypothetical protein